MSTTIVAPDEQTAPAPMAVRGGFRALGALLWRRRWIVLLVFALVANAIAAGLVLADREYTATARIAATPQEGTSLPASYEDLLGTLADVAESRPLLEEVADEVDGRFAQDLRDDVEGKVVPNTVIVQVSVTDTDPDRAAEIANEIVDQLPSHDPTGGSFDFDVTEEAVPPDDPSSPNVPVTFLAGLALGLVLAVAAAVVADRVFRTVTDPDELAEVSDTVVLGVLPKPADPHGIPAVDPVADEFQSIRALRFAIEFASAEDPSRLLVVTSASGSDPWAGWTEINVAAALGEVGHRVLVVNTDREADVHPALVAPGEPGLYDVLAGEVELVEAVRKGPTGLVDVLPVGQVDLASPSLLEMRFGSLLEDSEADYDVVIAHAAPVSTSEDARIMAIHGALLLTVPSGGVHPRFVRRAAEHLRGIRLRVLGSVLLGVRPVRRPRRTLAGA